MTSSENPLNSDKQTLRKKDDTQREKTKFPVAIT